MLLKLAGGPDNLKLTIHPLRTTRASAATLRRYESDFGMEDRQTAGTAPGFPDAGSGLDA
jgi:hypothetical protein